MQTKVFTKSEYLNLIPPVSSADYERLKQSIKEEKGLLMPIILNQNNVVLDGHHRLRACTELGIPVSFNTKDFTGRELDELKYVVAVNLNRRHLDEFQRSEIALKMERLARNLALKHQREAQFTSASAQKAVNKRYKQMPPEPGDEEEKDSPDTDASNTSPTQQDPEEGIGFRTREQLARDFGVSPASIDRVKTILDSGTSEQIDSLRNKSETGEGPGIRTVYEQVQSDKLKDKISSSEVSGTGKALRSDQLRLFNKDFRVITTEDIANDSVDLILALDFPDSAGRREDEGGRIHEQLMNAAGNWLKDGGLLVMHVEQRYLQRAICQRPPMLRFYHMVGLFDPLGLYEQPLTQSIFKQETRPLCVYVKGVADTQPQHPQHQHADHIGGQSEVFTDEKDFMTAIIKMFSPANSIICEPFMRKGITGLAALDAGRTYIGIERETTSFLSAMNMLYES